MKHYCLSHLTDETLLHDLRALISKDRITTAQLLAQLAEVDARQLYLPAGYPSMYAYCVGELGLCEQAALKRIHVARKARQFPSIFVAVAAGRLHLSAITLLGPYLTHETAEDLLGAAAGKSKCEIERLLAQRFPRSDVPPRLEVIGSDPSHSLAVDQLSPGRVEAAPVQIEKATPRPKVTPLSLERYVLQLTMSQETHDKLRHAQALLSHRIPNGNLAEVLDRVLDLAIQQLEKQKFAATSRPRSSQRGSSNPRTIPAHVRRTVWERDQGRCTFVSESGRHCAAHDRLEFDHIVPVGRGGEATVENLRLRCRAHNQYEASATFGAEFMSHKREEALERSAAKAREKLGKERAREVIPWLRQLGFTAQQARWRAERCEAIPCASLEDRVKLALSYVSPRVSTSSPSSLTPATGP